jgi:hypothetical protein
MLDPPGETLQVEYSYSEQKLRQQLQRKPTNGDAVVAARRQSRDASVLLVPSTSSGVVHDRSYSGSLLTHEESGRHDVVDHHLQDDDWEGRSRAVPYPPPQPTRPVQLPTMHEPGVTAATTRIATATAATAVVQPESKIMIESSTLSIAAGDVFFVGSSLLRDDHDRGGDDEDEMEFFHDSRPQAPTPSSISSSLVVPPEAELPQQLPWQQQKQNHNTNYYDNTDMAIQSLPVGENDHDDGVVPMIFDDNYHPEEEENGDWHHYEEQRQQRDAVADGGAVGRRRPREKVQQQQARQQPARHLDDGANVGAVAWPFSQQQQTQGSSGRGFADVNDDGAKKTGCGCCIS